MLGENFAGFLDDAFGGTPADQGHIGMRGPDRAGGGTADSIPATLRMRFSIMARRLIGIGEFVADQDAVFLMFIGGRRVGVAGNTGNGARRNAAVGDLVSLVIAVRSRRCRWLQ